MPKPAGVITLGCAKKIRIGYLDLIIVGLLVMFYIFLFLDEPILALTLFAIALVISLVALLKTKSPHAKTLH